MAETRLTRRDALAAAAAAGGSLVLSEAAVDRSVADRPDAELTDHELSTARAVADVVYPSSIEATPAFVETYLGRLDAARTAGLRAAVDALDDATRRRHGKRFVDIDSRGRRNRVLRSLGVDRAASVPDGTAAERIRYHLVNSLLYALFSTPRGGELVGIDNLIGHPGGAYAYDD